VDIGNFGQEVVADLSKPWTFLETSTVDHVYCKDGFEHQKNLQHFLAEAARVLKPGGTLEVWVPHFKNPSAYRMTHTAYFSWSCFKAYPEPHDPEQSLKVIRNRLYIGWATSTVWKPIHAIVNLFPKWWERLFYVSNIQVIFEKR
jgi:SAM-dependent methyltransferase